MIAHDKVMHAAFGAAAALGALAVIWLARNVSTEWAMLAAAIAVGVAYEIVQRVRGEGEPDVNDALATAAGGAVVTVAMSVLAHLANLT